MRDELALASREVQSGPLSVTQLVRIVRDTLAEGLGEYWVVGEISNAHRAASEHLYFTLKDAQSALNVVMWRTAARLLKFDAADGMEVIVRGRVDVYQTRGALQFYAEEMEPRGAGALQIAFDQLKRRLSEEGLFDPGHKRPLPFLPRTVGIVSAVRSAALSDMLRVTLERFPNLHLIVRPARVQGAGAAEEIADAIADLGRDCRVEVIIVGRGGGSLEDLWAFNEERVAHAIYDSPVPVISAVGHEVDYTIADFVADLRAPTPTAAAHMVVPLKADLRRRIDSLNGALRSAVLRTVSIRDEKLSRVARGLKHPRGMIRQVRQRLDESADELYRAARLLLADARRTIRELNAGLRSPEPLARRLRIETSRLALKLITTTAAAVASKRARLGPLAGRLDSLSPLRVLERGYAVVTNQRDGRAVLDALSVAIGDDLDIRLRTGRLRARTTGRNI